MTELVKMNKNIDANHQELKAQIISVKEELYSHYDSQFTKITEDMENLNKRVDSINSASSDAFAQANKNTTEIQILRVELANLKEQSSRDIVTLKERQTGRQY